MTRRQRSVLLAMQDLEDRGEKVTVRRLCGVTGISVGNVHARLWALIDLGYASRDHMTRRYSVARRVEPIVQYQVWDDQCKKLRDWK